MARWLLLPIFLALASCAHIPAQECANPIEIPEKIASSHVILFGEIHGTQEIPQFVDDVACQFVKVGRPVQIAIEHVASDQARIDAYLNSSGDDKAKRALIDSLFWRKALDGRATMAMLGLIEQLRSYKANGASVQIMAMDQPLGAMKKIETKDETMASVVDAAVASNPKAITLVLAGNIHTRRVERHPDFQIDPPMGYLLKTRDVLSFDAAFTGGKASTNKAPPGGEIFGANVEMKDALGPRRFVQSTEPIEGGYDGTFFVGSISASPHAALVFGQK